MSHQQQQQQQPALKPGDVFPASGDPIASAERQRALAPREDEDKDRLLVTETKLPGGKRIVTSSAKGQVLSQFAVAAPAPAEGAADQLWGGDKVTIGEALEAAAAAAGTAAEKLAVGRPDAAAVQAAETRATSQGRAAAGGVAAAMQKAAEANARTGSEEEKVKISDVLRDATARLQEDKVVTREDAERVLAAEKRNSEEGEGEGLVAAAMEAASRMNRGGVA